MQSTNVFKASAVELGGSRSFSLCDVYVITCESSWWTRVSDLLLLSKDPLIRPLTKSSAKQKLYIMRFPVFKMSSPFYLVHFLSYQDSRGTNSTTAGHQQPAPPGGGCHLHKRGRHVSGGRQRGPSAVASSGEWPGGYCIHVGKTAEDFTLFYLFLSAFSFKSVFFLCFLLWQTFWDNIIHILWK